MQIHRSAGGRVARLLVAMFLALALAMSFGPVTAGAGSGNGGGDGNAVSAKKKKKKCKKKGKKSGKKGKKKGCKKKKKRNTGSTTNPSPPTPSPTTPAPQTPFETLRASLSTADPNADFDLYVWDALGNEASYAVGENNIPNSRFTGDVWPFGPERFFDRLNPSTRDFTYGVCLYSDASAGDAEIGYSLNLPLDGGIDNDTLTGTGDSVTYLGAYDPDAEIGDWCFDLDEL